MTVPTLEIFLHEAQLFRFRIESEYLCSLCLVLLEGGSGIKKIVVFSNAKGDLCLPQKTNFLPHYHTTLPIYALDQELFSCQIPATPCIVLSHVLDEVNLLKVLWSG